MTLAITSYQLWLSIHILAVVVWVGSGFCLVVLVSRVSANEEPVAMLGLLRGAEFLGSRVFGPAGLVALIFGFILVADGDWSWHLWLVLGVIGWVAAIAHGAGVLGQRVAKLATALEAGGWTDTVRADLRSYLLHARLDVAFLVLVVLDMTLKPGA